MNPLCTKPCIWIRSSLPNKWIYQSYIPRCVDPSPGFAKHSDAALMPPQHNRNYDQTTTQKKAQLNCMKPLVPAHKLVKNSNQGAFRKNPQLKEEKIRKV
ncbi:unnamed protein product [Urochloa humidicola]